MNHPDYIRELIPLLHTSAEFHKSYGTEGMTEGDKAVYRTKVEQVRRAIIALAEFRIKHCAMDKAIQELIEPPSRFPASDEQH